MNKFEFACSLWGYDKVVSKEISKETIDEMFETWKFSMKSFKKWKDSQRINIK
jgi:hypothetical protein